MSDSEIDRIQVSQLPERYNLARSAVYTRLEALGLKPEKVGNRAYINAEQLKLLDELHEFIQTGRSTAEFLEMKGIQKVEEEPSGMSSGLSSVQPDMVKLIAVIAREFAARLQPVPTENRLAYYEILEKAYRNGWLLSTSELAELLDLLPSEIREYGDSFSEAGFVFTRAGYRVGGEVAWKVSKPVK
ncbi:hypothetical protein [Leptothermofonsia sp. ETS-13]|uniref:hypothetical protein n=1 Tax=Leptothermofonsia sp. ETS-13 TaxID=3035696 RepID=UPI003BA32880